MNFALTKDNEKRDTETALISRVQKAVMDITNMIHTLKWYGYSTIVDGSCDTTPILHWCPVTQEYKDGGVGHQSNLPIFYDDIEKSIQILYDKNMIMSLTSRGMPSGFYVSIINFYINLLFEAEVILRFMSKKNEKFSHFSDIADTMLGGVRNGEGYNPQIHLDVVLDMTSACANNVTESIKRISSI